MFPDRYFAPRYFAPRFWPRGVTPTVPVLPMRLAYGDSLEMRMALVESVAIGLAFGDSMEIGLRDTNLVCVMLSYDVLEHLQMTADDTIAIWMHED